VNGAGHYGAALRGPPILAVTMGDPGGIGPEVTVKALADVSLRGRARFRVFGPIRALEEGARDAGLAPYWTVVATGRARHGDGAQSGVEVIDYAAAPPFLHQPGRAGGEISFRLVEDAISAAQRPAGHPERVDGIVTGPISKHAWQLAGHGEFPGHTELLAARFGGARAGMMFVSPKLRVILATAHVPLMKIRDVLSVERVLQAIELGGAACVRLGIAKPRVAVCGLNPHAGEGGIMGDDEARTIEPAIKAARERGLDVRGPFPGDTVFIAAARGEYDLVVAMYHDQGLIPVKLLGRDEAVNVTVGLPIVRTSPDHGTAFDIAGKNKADPGSMRAAIELAIAMAGAEAR
jgi:4-phospho-D-threonate 3-dehydrogenase / 4-phospho-D-erythronate 3-dehydrogenase